MTLSTERSSLKELYISKRKSGKLFLFPVDFSRGLTTRERTCRLIFSSVSGQLSVQRHVVSSPNHLHVELLS